MQSGARAGLSAGPGLSASAGGCQRAGGCQQGCQELTAGLNQMQSYKIQGCKLQVTKLCWFEAKFERCRHEMSVILNPSELQRPNL